MEKPSKDADDFAKKIGLKVSIDYVCYVHVPDGSDNFKWLVTFRRGRKSYKFNFYTGTACVDKQNHPEKPSLNDIFYCLASDYRYFCENDEEEYYYLMGCDAQKAKRAYNDTIKNNNGVKRVLDDNFDDMLQFGDE